MAIRAFGRLLFSSFAMAKPAFKHSQFIPEKSPRYLFETLRSKRFVRRIGFVLVLVMGSTFAALQGNGLTRLSDLPELRIRAKKVLKGLSDGTV